MLDRDMPSMTNGTASLRDDARGPAEHGLASLQSRIATLADQARTTKEARVAQNRARCPEFAAFVDDFRRVFGDVRVRYVRWPDGIEQGTSTAGRGVSPALAPRGVQRRSTT